VRARAGRAWQPPAGARAVVLDTADAATLAGAVTDARPEIVFHLAATGVRLEERGRDALVEGNVGLTARLVEAVAPSSPRRFVMAGSCSEYAPGPAGARLGEAHPIAPTSSYGAGKAAAVVFARALARAARVPLVVVRPFGVFGPGERPGRLAPHVASSVLAGRSVALTSGEQRRDFTYVDDVIDAFLIAATSDALAEGEAYNVCTGDAISVRSFAERVADVVGGGRERLAFGALPDRTDEPAWIVGDGARFRAATGWAPRVDLDEGVRRTVAWVRSLEEGA
jgi:nucleoside-diphosphate-sugar epimerase